MHENMGRIAPSLPFMAAASHMGISVDSADTAAIDAADAADGSPTFTASRCSNVLCGPRQILQFNPDVQSDNK